MPGRNSWPSLMNTMRSRSAVRFFFACREEGLQRSAGELLDRSSNLDRLARCSTARSGNCACRRRHVAAADDRCARGSSPPRRCPSDRCRPASCCSSACRWSGRRSFAVPMPVSNRTRWSPVLTISAFCSSTAFVERQEIVGKLLAISSCERPRNSCVGSPSGRVPSDTTVAFGVAELEAIEIGRLRAEHRRFRERGSSRKSRHGSAALQQPAA